MPARLLPRRLRFWGDALNVWGGMKVSARIGGLLALAVVLGGCRTSVPEAGGRVAVIASFYPLAEFAQRVGGDRVRVTMLVPSGVEPHDYEPTPREIAALTRARVVIYNGAGFEPWLVRLLPEVAGRAVIVNTTQGLPLVEMDPHVWLDPLLARQQVERIAQGLIRADPAGRRRYETNANEVSRQLRELHARFSTVLAGCQRTEILTSHAAFGYLARRYGLTQIAISGLAPEAEPAPARLKELVETARRHDVEVIYVETLVSPRFAEVVAREVGAKVRTLNPIEGLTSEERREGKNYFTVMNGNLTQLAQGLDCR